MPDATIKIRHAETKKEKTFKSTAAFRTFMTKENDPQWMIVESDHADTTSLYIENMHKTIEKLEGEARTCERAAATISRDADAFLNKIIAEIGYWPPEATVYPPGITARRVIDAALEIRKETRIAFERAVMAAVRVFAVEMRPHMSGDYGYSAFDEDGDERDSDELDDDDDDDLPF